MTAVEATGPVQSDEGNKKLKHRPEYDSSHLSTELQIGLLSNRTEQPIIADALQSDNQNVSIQSSYRS